MHVLAMNAMYWSNLPLWFFTALYVAVLIYVVWALASVPPRRGLRPGRP